MINSKLNIEIIKKCILQRKVYWTRHCINKLNQRNILIEDIKTATYNGRIIEYYYEDYPYPSCLIMGYNINNIILHIVCGINDGIVYMITAYYPNINKWEKDMKTRRKRK